MAKIKIYTSYDEGNNSLEYRMFDIAECRYEIGDLYDREEIMSIEPIEPDIQSRYIKDFELYDYYRIETACDGEYDKENDNYYEYHIAMPKAE